MRAQMRSQRKHQRPGVAAASASRAQKVRQTQRRAMSATSRQAKSAAAQNRQMPRRAPVAPKPAMKAPLKIAAPKRSFTTTQPQQRQKQPTTQRPRQFVAPQPVLKQQQRPFSALPTTPLKQEPSSQIRRKFASLPTVANASGLISTIAATPEAIISHAARNLTTSNHTSSLVQRVTKNITPITIPHHSNIESSPLDTVPFFMPVRHMAVQKPKAGKDAKGDKKKTGGFEVDPGEEAFASAGDVKKNLRNWLEQIIQSKPEITPMPQAAIDNEELFVKECQTRFAQRLDERSRYEQAKIIIKQRAIAQLPGELKESATKPDPSLWSMRVMTPFSDPPRKRWLYDHYGIPYKATQQELDDEDFLKKKYARL